MKPSKHLFLIGFMGSGKSTIGSLLAERLELPFIDSDREIEKQQNKSIATIFSEQGEAAFRQMELDFLRQLENQAPAVVAVGGGLPCISGAIELMNQLGLTIYLNVSLLTLLRRLREERAVRPLLSALEDHEVHPFVEDLLSNRVQFYKRAQLIMPNESNKPNELVEKLLKELDKRIF